MTGEYEGDEQIANLYKKVKKSRDGKVGMSMDLKKSKPLQIGLDSDLKKDASGTSIFTQNEKEKGSRPNSSESHTPKPILRHPPNKSAAIEKGPIKREPFDKSKKIYEIIHSKYD